MAPRRSLWDADKEFPSFWKSLAALFTGNCKASAKIQQPGAQRMTRRNNFGAVEGETQLVSRSCGGFCGAGLCK